MATSKRVYTFVRVMKKLYYYLRQVDWSLFAVRAVFLSLLIGGVICIICLNPSSTNHSHKLEIVGVETMEHTRGAVLFGFGGVGGKGKIVLYVKTSEGNNARIFPYEAKLKDCEIFLSDQSYILYEDVDKVCMGKKYPKEFNKYNLKNVIYLSREFLGSK